MCVGMAVCIFSILACGTLTCFVYFCFVLFSCEIVLWKMLCVFWKCLFFRIEKCLRVCVCLVQFSVLQLVCTWKPMISPPCIVKLQYWPLPDLFISLYSSVLSLSFFLFLSFMHHLLLNIFSFPPPTSHSRMEVSFSLEAGVLRFVSYV